MTRSLPGSCYTWVGSFFTLSNDYLKRFSAVTIKVKIGTLLGTEWVLSIANWRQLSQRIAEQFFRIGEKVVQLEKAVATLVFF